MFCCTVGYAVLRVIYFRKPIIAEYFTIRIAIFRVYVIRIRTNFHELFGVSCARLSAIVGTVRKSILFKTSSKFVIVENNPLFSQFGQK